MPLITLWDSNLLSLPLFTHSTSKFVSWIIELVNNNWLKHRSSLCTRFFSLSVHMRMRIVCSAWYSCVIIYWWWWWWWWRHEKWWWWWWQRWWWWWWWACEWISLNTAEKARRGCTERTVESETIRLSLWHSYSRQNRPGHRKMCEKVFYVYTERRVLFLTEM